MLVEVKDFSTLLSADKWGMSGECKTTTPTTSFPPAPPHFPLELCLTCAEACFTKDLYSSQNDLGIYGEGKFPCLHADGLSWEGAWMTCNLSSATLANPCKKHRFQTPQGEAIWVNFICFSIAQVFHYWRQLSLFSFYALVTSPADLNPADFIKTIGQAWLTMCRTSLATDTK